MTADDTHSLADQAASWVPPWARKPLDDESEPEPGPEPEATLEAEPSPEIADVEPEAEPVEPEVEAAELEAEPIAEAEPSPLAEAGPIEIEMEVEPEPEAAPIAEAEPGPEAESAPADGFEPLPAAELVVAADSGALFEVPVEAAEEPEKTELSAEELQGAVEAIMLIVDEPATEIVLAQVLDQPVDRIAGVLAELADQYTRMGRGFELRRVAGGWRLYTRPEYASYVEKFVLDGQQVRLTQAALETLAVVAYKQPVTRSRISAIRGVNCDGVCRTLVARGLIEECGSEPESGAFLYRTTILFLEKLGLDSVDQLPSLAPFLPDDVDEIADAQR